MYNYFLLLLPHQRPFETIWGGHNSSSKRSKEESGDEDGEIISDDEMDEEEYSYHGNNMAENTSPPAFEHGRYRQTLLIRQSCVLP